MQGGLIITYKLCLFILLKSELLEEMLQPYMSSDVAKTIARYLASTLDVATTSCFLLFQDIKLPPMNTQYLDVEHLSVGELAQFAAL